MKKGVIKKIDECIKTVWINEMCREYGEGHLLLERSVQCSLYHHLRNGLDPLLKENHLQLYPEYKFNIQGNNYFADLAVCETDLEREDYHLHDRVTDIVAIIEIKYGGTVDYGRTDLPKMKMYAKSLGYDCQYYFAFIDERTEYLSLPLLDGRSRNHWAKGCFTELNAGYIDGTMWFEVNSYNGLNCQRMRQKCIFKW